MPSNSRSRRMRLGKKDVLLKNFFMAETEIPHSNIIETAIEYYMKFGQYLPLGTVRAENVEEIDSKSVYFSKNSPVIDYLEESGQAYKTLIKMVIEQGVIIGDRNELLSTADYFRAKQQIGAGTMEKKVIVQSVPKPEVVTIQKPVITPKKEVVQETKEVPRPREKKQITFMDGFVK